MAITITINQLDRMTDGNVVITAHWSAYKTVDGFTGSSYGTVSFPEKDPSDPDFVPYEDLTAETVENWVRSTLGDEQLEAMEAAYDASIAEQQAPKMASGLPWDNGVLTPV
jgi:hypothetical protein